MGLKICVKWWGVFQHHPLRNTENRCEKPKILFFCFQTGHIEIGKITKFGGVWRPFWGSLGWFMGGFEHPPPVSFRVKKVEFSVSKFRPAKKPSHIFHILICSCCGGTQLAVTTLVRNTYNRQLFTFRWLCTPTQSSSVRSPIFIHDQFSVKFLPFENLQNT